MSLILDALRKMEQERKNRLGASVDIRPEVLRYRGSVAPPPSRKPYLVGGVALALVALGVGAGLSLNGGKSAAVPEGPVAAVAPSALPQVPAPPVAVPQPAAPQPAPVAAPVAPQPQVAPQPVAAPAPAPPTAAAPAYGAPPAERLPAPVRGAKKAPRAAEPQPVAASVPDGTGAGDVTVSGIAWQEERSLRRAVINGVLVGEGAQVAGARVVEIKENRVRFSRGGQSFDVSYTTN